MTAVRRQYYESGNLMSEIFVMNGKKHGECKYYYDYEKKLRIMSIKPYIDNKLNGEIKNYYDLGQLNWICIYIDDMANGEYKQYYKNGKINIICNFIDNKLNGEYKRYNENGDLIEQSIYDNGEKIFTWKM